MKLVPSDVVQYDLLKLACQHEAAIKELTLSVAAINAALREVLGERFAEATLRLGPLLGESEAYQQAQDREKCLNESLERLKQRPGL